MRLLLLLLALTITTGSFAQRKVKLKQANSLKGSIRDGERFDKLLGDVILTQNNTTIYCDSAYLFKATNRVEGYGHIHITEGDSIDCTALELLYEGDKKLAHLRKKVVFTKKGIATLYTDFLDYDRAKNKASYFNGGKLVDTTNTLVSRKGYYDIHTNMASFKKEVVGVSPDYTLKSDTLQYNSKTKVIYFRDSTTVRDKDGGTAVYLSGYYDTNQKSSNLNKAVIENEEYRMKGDTYVLDDKKKFYKARGHVVMTSKKENLIIFGDEGYMDKIKGISKVYNHAYVAKITDDDKKGDSLKPGTQDTLFIHADTLVSIDSKDPRKKRLLAYHKVKIFKNDMQGIADSLAYVAPDSTLYFYRDPVLWTTDNQMTADSIRILMRQKKIDKIYLVSNAFVVSQDTLKNFNQIKGRKMTAYFDGKTIHHVVVEGNGESIYYALEEVKARSKKDTVVKKLSVTMGLNKIICSNMKINFKLGKVKNISFYVKPDASFIPPHEWTDGDLRLRGFSWRLEEKPAKADAETKSPPATVSNP